MNTSFSDASFSVPLLSDQAIHELQAAYHADYGIELSWSEASKFARELLQLTHLISQPIDRASFLEFLETVLERGEKEVGIVDPATHLVQQVAPEKLRARLLGEEVQLGPWESEPRWGGR